MRREFEFEYVSNGDIACRDGKKIFAVKADSCACGDTVSFGLPYSLIRLHGMCMGEGSVRNSAQTYQKILNPGTELARICAANEAAFPLVEEKLDRWVSRLAIDDFGITSSEIDSATDPRTGCPRRTGHAPAGLRVAHRCPLCLKHHVLSA
jgi:hypothetical protein